MGSPFFPEVNKTADWESDFERKGKGRSRFLWSRWWAREVHGLDKSK